MQKFLQESWLVVSLAAFFAIMLAATQVALRSTIDANAQAELDTAIAVVIPNYEQSVASQRFWDDITDEVDGQAVSNDVFECLSADGNTVGWAILGGGTGFVDRIELVVGLTADRSEITGIKVIKSLETPGLGDKILAGDYPNQYTGLTTGQEITVSKQTADLENGVIQAITGATYSSEYTAAIVNDILKRVVPKLEQLSKDDAKTTSKANKE
jgi:electron transport complex protein RnfG